MPEIDDSINAKQRINLARNTPLALVVGVAGFIGSNLAEKLLEKNIQVIGVDNFSTGDKLNLEVINKDNNFHFLNINAEEVNLDLDRLDYIFIVAGGSYNFGKLINLAKEYKSKIILTSDINLYEKDIDEALRWFKEAESEIAKFSSDEKINARVVRLGPIYGPKMVFSSDDPTLKLIKSSLDGDLPKESTALDFSSRALFIDDCIDLILKSMFTGSTALKIFDGVGEPVKVAEIRQVLMDPLWHENKGFNPSPLPPWNTPNLEKTKHELHWSPKTNLVKGLRETLSYFKDHEITAKETYVGEKKEEVKPQFGVDEQKRLWEEEKKRRLGELGTRNEELGKNNKVKSDKKENNNEKKKSNFGRRVGIFLGIGIIVYGLIYPIINFGYGVFTFKHNLTLAAENLRKGEFDQSLADIEKSKSGLKEASNFIGLFENLDEPIFKGKLNRLESLIDGGELVLDGSTQAVDGSRSLYQSVLSISGETAGNERYFADAEVSLEEASNDFAKAQIIFSSSEIGISVIDDQIKQLASRVETYSKVSNQVKELSLYLPKILGENQKSYLVVLNNNYSLRPAGGVLEGAVKVDLDKGVIKKVDTFPTKDLTFGEAPADVKTDLSLTTLKFNDLGFDPDFTMTARRIISGNGLNNIDGVFLIDLETINQLLKVGGPLTLDGIEINAENFNEKVVTGKLKGEQLVNLEKELLNKMLFVPKKNWVEVVMTLGEMAEGKHSASYFKDPALLGFVTTQNLTGSLPRVTNKSQDFLGIIESNVGGNLANYYVDRSDELSTTINEATASQKLKLSYTNRSQTLSYKDRIKVILPLGTKLNRVSWGESDVRDRTQVSDFGRSVNSFLIDLPPQSQKTLVLEYDVPLGLKMGEEGSKYNLLVFKQLGSKEIPFTLNFNGKNKEIIQTKISSDKLFEIGL